MAKAIHLLSVLALAALITGTSYAAGESEQSRENAELKQRVEQLDKKVEELKKIVANQTGTPEESSEKQWVWSNLDVQLYGRLKLDASYDSSRVDVGDFARWVDPENFNPNDEQFDMTANETRLGMLINGPDDGNLITSGRVEVDFYGGGDENKSHLMMRHAYMKMDWPNKRFNIIAGQTSDVISPLVPDTLNYSVLWWVGNIGYRRPQIRLTKEYTVKNNVELKLEGAVARTIGRTNMLLPAAFRTDSGEDAGFPTLQARAGVTLPIFGEKKTTVGVSGHWGKEEYDITITGINKKFTSWSLNMDLTQPVNNKCLIKAEVFTGKDLDAYLGGIGQGVTTAAGINQYDEIGSSGGWIAATLGPWDNFSYNVGVGMDDAKRENLQFGNRTQNRAVFGNVIYAANKHTDIGFELSYWRTEYYGPGDAESLRAQLSFIYNF
jgi:hypothetical protein